MLKVKLKREPIYSERIKHFIKLGEPVPQIGEIYTVIEHIHYEDVSEFPHLVKLGLTEYNGYVLEEFDWSEIGLKIGFDVNYFEIISDEFTPNKYIINDYYEGYAEQTSISINFKI